MRLPYYYNGPRPVAVGPHRICGRSVHHWCAMCREHCERPAQRLTRWFLLNSIDPTTPPGPLMEKDRNADPPPTSAETEVLEFSIITETRRISRGARSIRRLVLSYIWVPESDAPQNGKGLLFEFPFGQLNAAKGKKRLLPQEAFADAKMTKIVHPRSRSLQGQLLLAKECQQKLLDFPALTRNDIAKQLGVTTARVNQILRLLRIR